MTKSSITYADLFHPEPDRFGLRGDTYLWEEMKDVLSQNVIPQYAEELNLVIATTFFELTGLSITSSEPSIYVERYDHGGMSHGRVSLRFWRDIAMPLLVERLANHTRNHQETPVLHMDEFSRRLQKEWLIPFCQTRNYSHEGFVRSSLDKLSPVDASDFMQALDYRLVHHQNGTFMSSCSCAKEQIFWEHEKSIVPRKVTLWLEPIITIAGLMRLHRDFGWPVDRLGMQSRTWAFDLVAYAEDRKTELLVCEVKKVGREVDRLINLMIKHAETPSDALPKFKGAERNALKKIIGLRQAQSAETLWVLGPNSYSHVFEVLRKPNGAIHLSHGKLEMLCFLAD